MERPVSERGILCKITVWAKVVRTVRQHTLLNKEVKCPAEWQLLGGGNTWPARRLPINVQRKLL